MISDPSSPTSGLVQVVPLLRVRSLAGRTFDYRLPPELEGEVGPGDLVVVPFARRKVRGVVWELGPSEELAAGRVPLERVLSVLERAEQRIPPDLLELAERLSDYALAPLGACLQAIAPPAAPKRTGRLVTWVLPAPPPAADHPSSRPAEAAAGDGALAAHETPVTNVHLAVDGEAVRADDRPLTPKQRLALDAVPAEGAPLPDLVDASGVGRGVFDALVRRGALQAERRRERPGDRPPSGRAALAPSGQTTGGPEEGWLASATGGAAEEPSLVLTGEQAAVLDELTNDLDEGTPRRRVLWGVTGSGKTEVYLRLLERVVRAGGGAILLVPEIALTMQTVARLRERLPVPVAVLHSGITPLQRAEAHRALAAGEVRVVVGARSAVFAAVRDLRLVIVDEAHDTSYKQEEEPRYDARRVAWWRVEAVGGLLVEGSATPRSESLVFPEAPLRLRERPGGASLPAVEAVDMRRQGGRHALAPRSRAALRGVLGAGGQAIVLLNRRGYASFLRCDVCGHVVMCPRCEISLTYHRSQHALLCHACGFQRAVPVTCPECHEAALSRGSPGTQRLAEELLQLVPRTRLFRLDSDVVTSGTRVTDLLASFAEARPGVLVGTQMVAKGHDFPHVSLAVVVDADTALFTPDFRAEERTFQLLTQVAGRPGRRQAPGRVLVQTWNPDVACIRMALGREEEAFYRAELAARERLGYPPFRSLIRLVLASPQEERTRTAAVYLADRLRPHLAPDELLGPARLPRLRGVSRWQLLLVLVDQERGRRLVRQALDRLRAPYARRQVDVLVDVDPQSLQ